MMWIVPGAVLLLFALISLWLGRPRPASIESLRDRFRLQREHLEAHFFQIAAASGKPRGLRWEDCQWEDAVEFARDRATRQVLAFVGITVQFSAIEGGDMEGLPAVGNLRNATAVFFFEDENWRTKGKTVFNLNPDEALERFQLQLERLSPA